MKKLMFMLSVSLLALNAKAIVFIDYGLCIKKVGTFYAWTTKGDVVYETENGKLKVLRHNYGVMDKNYFNKIDKQWFCKK